MTETQNKKRVQFDFHPQALEKLDGLVEKTGSSSRAEVVRKALSLLSMTIDAQEAGKSIYFVDGDTQERVITLW